MSSRPNIFAVPLGASFPDAFVDGFLERYGERPPQDIARATIVVNTARMGRAMRESFARRGAMLLPRIVTLAQLGDDPEMAEIPPAQSPLRRRLDIARLTAALIEHDPSVAPRESSFALADDLASLLDELHGEGVSPEALSKIDVTNASRHWDRSLKFFEIVRSYADDTPNRAPDSEERQRMVIERLVERWKSNPPAEAMIVAGSTGSRGATALLMRSVTRLREGAVVLPGFDWNIEPRTWHAIETSPLEDHPQFRFAAFLKSVDASPGEVANWAGTATDENRNRLVSLALRPAPVTSSWIAEGPGLGPLEDATSGLSLIEAPTPRIEAAAIAFCIREAVETGKTIALISPDRNLTRQVTAALDRWAIEPDDSAGRPLALSAPGRLLRQFARLRSDDLPADEALAALANPLAATGGSERGTHILLTRELEHWLRRTRVVRLNEEALRLWQVKERDGKDGAWVDWVCSTLLSPDPVGEQTLSVWLKRLRDRVEAVATGPNGAGTGELWEMPAGEAAQEVLNELAVAAKADDRFDARSFGDLVDHVLNSKDVRNPIIPNPNALIWGTLEARVQGASHVILAGLNDGIWPARPKLDAWLNRDMRRQVGLLLPDRQIGLSAHDFQQAIAAENVVLTRSLRDTETETVPSRWLNRITSLLDGLPDTGGPEALRRMRARGRKYLDWATAIDRPSKRVDPAPRPSPRPPVSARPKRLSVTQFQTLVRDPYAVYAARTLGLRGLDPFSREPDARDRGTILHAIVERFLIEEIDPNAPDALTRLREIAEEQFASIAPFPLLRSSWQMAFDRIAPEFLAQDAQRRLLGTPLPPEQFGELHLNTPKFTISGTVDRIDLTPSGELIVYDYKSGSASKEKEIHYFDRQLLIEAVMAEAGTFPDVPKARVDHVAYIGLGTQTYGRTIPLDESGKFDFSTKTVLADLKKLLLWFGDRSHGYTARRAVKQSRFEGEFDHLSRYGEWDESTDPTPEDVG